MVNAVSGSGGVVSTGDTPSSSFESQIATDAADATDSAEGVAPDGEAVVAAEAGAEGGAEGAAEEAGTDLALGLAAVTGE